MIAAAALPGHAFRLRPHRSVPAGSERCAAPTLTADRYVAADGTALPVAVWPAANGQPKAVILGLHGFGDYRKAWEEPAEIWAKAGITTYSYDQRGFGESPTRGRWPGTEALVDDAKAMAALLRAQYPGVPLYLAGESMGGAVALVAADRGMRGRRADPARAGAALARHVRAGRQRRPVVLRPHHPVVALRPDLDRLQADRQSQDAREAAQRSA